MPQINLGIAPLIAGQGLVFSGVTLHVTPINSVTLASGKLELANDVGSPGNNQAYSTNSAGVKGWYPISGSSAGTSTGGATTDQLTQTGVILGSRIDQVTTNLGSTGTTLISLNLSTSGDITDRLTQTGISLIAADLSLSGALNLKIVNTGQTAWTHGQNNPTS